MDSFHSNYGHRRIFADDVQPGLANLGTAHHLAGNWAGDLLYLQPPPQQGATDGRSRAETYADDGRLERTTRASLPAQPCLPHVRGRLFCFIVGFLVVGLWSFVVDL